jgi:hypothetical protein
MECQERTSCSGIGVRESREEGKVKEGESREEKKTRRSKGFTTSNFSAFLSFTSCPLIETIFMDIIPAHSFTEYGILQRTFT